jgi:hypothetical protein
MARSLVMLEAFTGVMYIALVMSGLIGLEMLRRDRIQDAAGRIDPAWNLRQANFRDAEPHCSPSTRLRVGWLLSLFHSVGPHP